MLVTMQSLMQGIAKWRRLFLLIYDFLLAFWRELVDSWKQRYPQLLESGRAQEYADDVIINLMMGSMSFGVTNVLSKDKGVGWFGARVNRAISSRS